MSGEGIESLQLVESQSVGKNLSRGIYPSYCVMISSPNCKSNWKAGHKSSALLTAPCEGFTNTNRVYLLSYLHDTILPLILQPFKQLLRNFRFIQMRYIHTFYDKHLDIFFETPCTKCIFITI